jgi:hypothetical protein
VKTNIKDKHVHYNETLGIYFQWLWLCTYMRDCLAIRTPLLMLRKIGGNVQEKEGAKSNSLELDRSFEGYVSSHWKMLSMMFQGLGNTPIVQVLLDVQRWCKPGDVLFIDTPRWLPGDCPMWMLKMDFKIVNPSTVRTDVVIMLLRREEIIHHILWHLNKLMNVFWRVRKSLEVN